MFARTLRTTFAAALLALSVVPAAAFASPADSGAKTSIREEKEKASFPMPAATFKAKVQERITKMRERVVAHMNEKKIAADKQKERLAKLDAGAAKVMAKVDEVGADGTVTKEEAREVHKLARELHGKGRGEHHGKGKEGATRGRGGEDR